MKSDVEIRNDILAELKWQPGIDETEIGVSVEDGILTLSGVVNEYHKKAMANKAAKSVTGVKAVAEDIVVKYGEDYKKTDKEIAKAAVNAIDWNASIPKEKVMIFVEDGYIYLSGEVPWDYQRNAAKRTVQNLLGVKGVINNIEIAPNALPQNVEREILKALERSANMEAKGIQVKIDGHIVQLAGKVHSLKEKEEAEKAAYNAPGVRMVKNDIVVQPDPEFVLRI
jgi:osmotically-inducible protein OsmY